MAICDSCRRTLYCGLGNYDNTECKEYEPTYAALVAENGQLKKDLKEATEEVQK